MAAVDHAAEFDRIREVTQEILARREFLSEATSMPWYLELLNRLEEWARQFSVFTRDHPFLGWLLMVVLIVIALGLLLHLLYVALGDLLPWNRRKRDPPRPSPWTILEGAAESWHSALGKAFGALAQGNERLAVWIGHRVLLGLLDEQGAIRFARGKTNSDYLSECAADHPWRETLLRCTEIYERVVYGHRPVGPAALAPVLNQVQGYLQREP